MLEEAALALDDRLRDPQDRLEPLLHVADQPLGFLQLRRELLRRRVAGAREDVRVDAVDAQLRHRRVVERGGPVAAHLAHDHVGHDVVRLGPRERRAGARVERPDELADRAHRGVVALQDALELRDVAVGEEVEVRLHDLERLGAPGRRHRQRLELQRERLAEAARAHARRLEALQVGERDRELLDLDAELLGKELRDLLERAAEDSVLVERVDERRDELPVALRQRQHAELLPQVVAQRRRRRLLRVELLVVVAGGRRAPVAVSAAAFVDEVDLARGHAALGGVRGVDRLVRALVVGVGDAGRFRRVRGGPGDAPGGLRGAGLGSRTLAILVVVALLEQRVLLQHPLDLGVELERRELQQSDRLLKLRRQREVLRELELERGLHREACAHATAATKRRARPTGRPGRAAPRGEAGGAGLGGITT